MADSAPSTSLAKRQTDDSKSAPQPLVGFLEKRIHFFIDDYKDKRKCSRRNSVIMKIIMITFSASITITSGIGASSIIDDTHKSLCGLITLILGSLLTGVGAWEAFADHRWKWIRYRATLSTLYALQEDLLYRQADGKPITMGEAEDIYEQLRRAVHETNQEWISQRGNSIRSDAKGGSS